MCDEMTANVSSPSDSIAYHHFTSFLNDIKEYESTGGSSLNPVYSDYADTPTRKRNRILQKRNETLEKLEKLSMHAVSSSWRRKEQCGSLLNIKFVGLLVHFLCDEAWIDGTESRQSQGDEKQSLISERFDEMLQMFMKAMREEMPLETSWKDDLNVSIVCPQELTVVDLCRLPSLILDNLELGRRQKSGQHSKKKMKFDMLSDTGGCKHSLLKTYAILGYLVTCMMAHDLKGVVTLQSLQRHIHEQVVTGGLVEDRMYSMEYDAVMSGSIAYFLDCMDVSSMAMEEVHDVNDNAKDKICVIGDELMMEDVQVGMIVDGLLGKR